MKQVVGKRWHVPNCRVVRSLPSQAFIKSYINPQCCYLSKYSKMSEKSVKKMVCIGTYMKCLKPLYTKIRSKDTGHVEFVKYANRIMTLICEEGFAYSKAVTTTRPPNDDRSSHRESSLPTTPRIESRIIQTSAGECLVTESYDVDIPLTLTGNMTSVTTPTGSTFIGTTHYLLTHQIKENETSIIMSPSFALHVLHE